MNHYFAPLEGLTDGIYRRLHQKHFPGLDRYYTPFFSPTIHRCLTPREQRELPPADTWLVETVPQILTKVSADFIWMAQQCLDHGYKEVNLNLGCPSGTVTAKGKGAGMLTCLQDLDRFLDKIFSGSPLPISIKTRIGFRSADEFPNIMNILRQYPVKELTVHPRIRMDFYNNQPNMEAFAYALAESTCPVCYNGDLYNRDGIQQLSFAYPQVQAVMLGRGLIADPGMLSPGGTTARNLEAFHDELLEAYIEAFGGARNAMFRMKENWHYMLCKFENNQQLGKALRKVTDVDAYRAITHEIFRNLPLREQSQPQW